MKLLKISRDNLGGTKLGMTVIETVVILGLVASIFAFGAVVGLDAVGRSSVFGERDLFVSLLISARTRALANIDESPHGVFIDTDSFVIFSGNSYNPSDTSNQVVERNSAILITGINTVIFDQLSGNVSSHGNITLSDGTDESVVEIGEYGLIEW